jgi:hypothetical protein
MAVDVGTVHRWISTGRLYAITSRGELRLPGWQFTSTGSPVPGLRRCLTALPAGLHPALVEKFFTAPQAALEPDAGALSPGDWLAEGLDPAPVVCLAREQLAGAVEGSPIATAGG